jgi:Tannase and feruloyl esterase
MELKELRLTTTATARLVALLAVSTLAATGPARAASCEALAALDLPGAELTLAERVPAGGLELAGRNGPGAEMLAAQLAELPAFCRVAATLRPTPDSAIQIEVWLPEEEWNGRLQSVGNGAWAGSISYGALADAVAAGFAAASTDTGHEGNVATFVVGHPEKLVDFAYRAVHEMTVAAKAIVAARYAGPPQASYFVGCSTGGRQALAEAQRYPEDYDGIVAGAAAYHPTHLQAEQIWTAIVGQRAPDAGLTAEQLPLLNAAVLASCDTLDGVADGVVENPAQCAFDPRELVCETGQTAGCLSPAQAETARRIYAGPTTAAGESLFPGVARGSELGWNDRVTGEPISLAVDTYRYLVYADARWDYRHFDPERSIPDAMTKIASIMNSTDPNIEPFLAHGGKLLLYHGWNDFGVPPLASVRYYERVVRALGAARADDGVRLFMVPGMNHCRGGVGTDRFDTAAAIDRWVTTGTAPTRIEAARVEDGEVVRTRPLCPYPQVAAYDGSGSTDESSNFTCREETP